MQNKKENEVKKIIISEKTLEQLPSKFLEKLKEENNVELIVVGNDMVCDAKMIAHQEGASIIILSEDGKKEIIEQKLIEEESENRVFEIKELPFLDMPEAKYLYVQSEKKQKFYVPRTIGRPISKKKGGR